MSSASSKKIGLALAGGGMEGAVYELGVLRALDEALVGLEMHELPVYVGVSAGAFIASCLANGMSTASLCRNLIQPDPKEHPFVPELFLRPAVDEFVLSGLKVPGLLWDGVRDFLKNPIDRSPLSVLAKLSRALPVGLLSNEPIRKYLETVFEKDGRTNDFRRLKRELYVVSTDLDSGEAVIFGDEGWDDVPIARAVQASTALPGLYPPVTIGNRHYVDGVLLKTLHASTVLETGADLVICVNPIVPVDTSGSVEAGVMRRGKLVDRGMPSVLSQTFRTLIYSRLKVGLAAYGTRFEKADVLLFEPGKNDYAMFFTNIFSFRSRKAVCERAYRSTLRDLSARRDVLAPILAKHGLSLREEVVADPERNLWEHVGLPPAPEPKSPAARLELALGRLEAAIAQVR